LTASWLEAAGVPSPTQDERAGEEENNKRR